MISSINNIKGDVIKDNDTYLLEDNNFLNRLTVSKTTLHPTKHTTGHSHEGVEEVYFFTSGRGRIQVDDKFHLVGSGSVVQIPDGSFHKVFNIGDSDLIFVSVFERYTR